MIASQRRWHLRVWVVLVVALAALLVWALAARRAMPVEGVAPGRGAP